LLRFGVVPPAPELFLRNLIEFNVERYKFGV